MAKKPEGTPEEEKKQQTDAEKEVARKGTFKIATKTLPAILDEIDENIWDIANALRRSEQAAKEAGKAAEAAIQAATEAALQAAEDALAEGDLTLDGMLARMRGVRYVSTLVVQELDPDLKTFFRVRGEVDLKRAEILANPRKKSKNRFQQT